ncbi:MAG: DUF3106 domain-containing protein [Rhizobacter sp.]|nr:DUF3106 domain-containing protein [Rhizobacter sp.]
MKSQSNVPAAASASRQVLPRGLPIFVVLCAVALAPVAAQSLAPAQIARPAFAAEEGVRWQDLQPAQRQILRPLERDWATTDATRKQKWLDIAARFPTMPTAEQARIQARMAEWARLSPEQRGQARQNYQAAKQMPAQDRQAQWEAYQSLSAEEKRRLAARATRAAPPAVSGRTADAARGADMPARDGWAGRESGQAKSNIVPNPAHATPARRVAPTMMQAQPGATTTVISKRPAPPPHQQTGLPKISAGPNFVDKTTLLPQRGPQGAATRVPAASSADVGR